MDEKKNKMYDEHYETTVAINRVEKEIDDLERRLNTLRQERFRLKRRQYELEETLGIRH